MKTRLGTWTRRDFLEAGAAFSAVAVARRAHALAPKRAPVYAIVASSINPSGSEPADLLQSFRVTEGLWTLADEVALPSRVHLAMHPTQRVVYACHDVALWKHLPRGAVSAWSVGAADGKLAAVGVQPLSLAAIHPRFALVTADGASLVTGTRGGMYNVLPLAGDGTLQPVSAIRKEHGRMDGNVGVTASPRHAAAHHDGSIFTLEDGQQTLSHFSVQADSLVLRHRLRLPAAARRIVVSHCGRWAYVLHNDDASVSVYRIAPQGVFPAHQRFAGTPGAATLERCPDGRGLLRADADGVSLLSLCASTGRILGVSAKMDHPLRQIAVFPGGSAIAGVDRARGEVMLVPLHGHAKGFGRVRPVAHVPGCTGLVFCSV